MIDDPTAPPDDPVQAAGSSARKGRLAAARALANRLAGIEKRKATIRKTMVGAKGKGVKPTAPAKPATRSRPRPRLASEPASEILTRIDDVAAVVAAAESMPRTRIPKRRAVTQAQLVARLSNLIARQLDVIEDITGSTDPDDARRGDAERHARTVATLSRVLGELRKHQRDEQGSPDDDDRPRDLDEVRARLSRRLEQRLAGGGGASVEHDDGGGDDLPG